MANEKWRTRKGDWMIKVGMWIDEIGVVGME